MDAGLYKLSADQTNLDAESELISFNSTTRSCTGVSLSAGVFTLAAGTYLILGNFDFTRTAGAGTFTWVHYVTDPSGTPNLLGFSFPALNPTQDGISGHAGDTGPQVAVVQTAQNLTFGPVISPSAGTTFTCNSAYTWLSIVNLTGTMASSGLYGLSGDQTNFDTAGEQIVWNSTLRACSGVTLSSGAFTFTSDGIYVVIGGVQLDRTSGTGKTIAVQWTTDSTTTGTSAYSVAVPSHGVTGDATTETGSHAGCIAVVNRSGSDVTIGVNCLSVAATTVFTVESDTSNVMVMRLT